MSASTEKKNRQAAREAGTDKKAIAEAEEAAKKAKSKRKWTIGTVLVVLLIAGILFLNSGILYTGTKAVTIGDESYSPAELSYYYASQYNNFVSQYGSYAGIFGLDTSNGIAGLDSQVCSMTDGGTWKDYFMDAAISQMTSEKAILDYAKANGIELTEEEKTAVTSELDNMDEVAKMYGYSGADNFFAANYGTGVNTKLVRECSLRSALASKAYGAYADTLQYTDEELEEYYQSLNGASDAFNYSSYTVNAEAAEDGTYSDEALAAAKSAADDILAAYKKTAGDDVTARLDEAVKTYDVEASSTIHPGTAGSSLSIYEEWMMAASRKTGDANVFENVAGNGYTVVAFISHNDNHYNLANVRHILIKAEADENGEYTDEAKAAAKARAEEILAEWKAGEATEDSFAELANLYSADEGSNTAGGLYEDVYQDEMVKEFNDFCFGGRKSGDTGIVYGESAGYAGYHVIYYVGDGEMYSNAIAKNDLMTEALDSWLSGLTESLSAEFGYFSRLAA